MSIYKSQAAQLYLQELDTLAQTHALSIDINFEVLNQAHNPATCECCQLHGDYFVSLVKKYSNYEDLNHVS